ncbi:ATPase [Alkalispirochaeta odontotermitis]|nr:ATPase [Alkalispirochaeta odontotermitis]CAB1079916.1 ATP-dependent Clp protease ATP-binding subunit ClpX [Olavius algarvensis Delta 1 endosymbiont]
MNEHNEKIPDPKELEKEIGEFLAKKFGENVKVVSPAAMPQEAMLDKSKDSGESKPNINFDLKPEELISYLDQYVVKQDNAKAILATKVCTHFNRIKRAIDSDDATAALVGRIKNNVLMIGPTGVGKTYIIKLIANKLGVPFVKGDATKFSETGYVGGDVEDLVRDLVREADDNIELAQYGIIYIDEIDKIASSRNLIGADVSRTGVQRALLKPMEETDVDLKVPHDPISMIQEIDRFRKTGKRDKRTVNTGNILFIMSGAFTDLVPIIQKRLSKQDIGFGARIRKSSEELDILKNIRSEDLTQFGFESEFVGRLPVRAVFEHLTEDDLYQILKNPNNPIILGKKLDFAAYGIDVKFEDRLLRKMAKHAFVENTGARGLVSAVETALLDFERRLPSTGIRQFPATAAVIDNPDESIASLADASRSQTTNKIFAQLINQETEIIREYLKENKSSLAEKYSLTMTSSRMNLVASCYARNTLDIGNIITKIKSFYDEIKKIELYFFKNHDINIVFEEDAIDFIIEQLIEASLELKLVYQKIDQDFQHGLKLAREKINRNRFFITREALLDPEAYVANLIKDVVNLPSDPAIS